MTANDADVLVPLPTDRPIWDRFFGVFPLAIATGAGAHSRVAIGTAVIGGMLTATALAIFFVPMFFVLVRNLFNRRRRRGGEEQPERNEEAPA